MNEKDKIEEVLGYFSKEEIDILDKSTERYYCFWDMVNTSIKPNIVKWRTERFDEIQKTVAKELGYDK